MPVTFPATHRNASLVQPAYQVGFESGRLWAETLATWDELDQLREDAAARLARNEDDLYEVGWVRGALAAANEIEAARFVVVG